MTDFDPEERARGWLNDAGLCDWSTETLAQELRRAYKAGQWSERAAWLRLDAERVYVACSRCGAGNPKEGGFCCRMCGARIQGEAGITEAEGLRAKLRALARWCLDQGCGGSREVKLHQVAGVLLIRSKLLAILDGEET